MSGDAIFRLRSGEIDLPTGLNLGPGFVESELLEAALEIRPYVHNGPYRSYLLPEMPIDGRPFIPVIFFLEEVAMEIQLHAVDPSMRSWDDHSDEKCLALKDRNDRLLEALAGHRGPYVFPWGRAESFFDQRSGSVAISLIYGV